MDTFNTKIERITTAKENIKQSLINKGTSPSDNLEDYAALIDEIQSGGGDVKLFKTIDEMNEDTTVTKEGELAVVYGNETAPATVDSIFDTVVFPKTVILPSAYTTDIDVQLRAQNGSAYMYVFLTQTAFSIEYSSMDIQAQYTSTDGITYTRTTLSGSVVSGDTATFTNPLIVYEPDYWDDNVGYFMQVSSSNFGGLYNSRQVEVGYKLKYIKDMCWQNGAISYSISDDYYDFTKLVQIIREKAPYKQVSIFIVGNIAYLQWTPDYYGFYEEDGSFRFAVGLKTTDVTDYLSSIDMTTWEINKDLAIPADANCYALFQNSQGLVNYYYSTLKFDKIDKFVELKIADTTVTNMSPVWLYSFKKGVLPTSTSVETEMQVEYAYKYFPATVQFDATSDYVYAKSFMGKNGVETGTLTNNISTAIDDINAEIYLKLKDVYNNLEPVTVATTSEFKTIFNNKTRFIPMKVNTTEMTSMSSMFNYFTLLQEVNLSGFDTTNVTSMSSMFSGCNALRNIDVSTFNTSNVTEMSSMFSACKAITRLDLSNFNTSKVTTCGYLFDGCSALEYIDLSSATFDVLGNVQYAGKGSYDMFRNCTSLKYINISSWDLANISQYCNTSRMFNTIPADCEIIVKNQAAKDWILTQRSDLTNVKIKA